MVVVLTIYPMPSSSPARVQEPALRDITQRQRRSGTCASVVALGTVLTSAGAITVATYPKPYESGTGQDPKPARRSTPRRGHRAHGDRIGHLPTMGALANRARHGVITGHTLVTVPCEISANSHAQDLPE